jgi:hypothetical protein
MLATLLGVIYLELMSYIVAWYGDLPPKSTSSPTPRISAGLFRTAEKSRARKGRIPPRIRLATRTPPQGLAPRLRYHAALGGRSPYHATM